MKILTKEDYKKELKKIFTKESTPEFKQKKYKDLLLTREKEKQEKKDKRKEKLLKKWKVLDKYDNLIKVTDGYDIYFVEINPFLVYSLVNIYDQGSEYEEVIEEEIRTIFIELLKKK